MAPTKLLIVGLKLMDERVFQTTKIKIDYDNKLSKQWYINIWCKIIKNIINSEISKNVQELLYRHELRYLCTYIYIYIELGKYVFYVNKLSNVAVLMISSKCVYIRAGRFLFYKIAYAGNDLRLILNNFA